MADKPGGDDEDDASRTSDVHRDRRGPHHAPRSADLLGLAGSPGPGDRRGARPCVRWRVPARARRRHPHRPSRHEVGAARAPLGTDPGHDRHHDAPPPRASRHRQGADLHRPRPRWKRGGGAGARHSTQRHSRDDALALAAEIAGRSPGAIRRCQGIAQPPDQRRCRGAVCRRTTTRSSRRSAHPTRSRRSWRTSRSVRQSSRTDCKPPERRRTGRCHTLLSTWMA